jgi:predicted nucleic acid-binding protein
MRYLLDVNLLVAWGWEDHTEHDRAAKWIASAKRLRETELLTSAIPQLGFVRVSVQRTGGRLALSEAAEVLTGMINSLGRTHAFVPDNVDSTTWPAWCRSASRSTDAHLVALANAQKAKLATLDTEIPDSFLVPL